MSLDRISERFVGFRRLDLEYSEHIGHLEGANSGAESQMIEREREKDHLSGDR